MLRVLMVAPVPSDPRLGAGRHHLEFAAEMRRQGHSVDIFDLSDAFPREPRSRLMLHLRPRFSRKVRRHVMATASRYDVIDAREGAVPFAKAELGFDGLLVARAMGLSHLYREFVQFSLRNWPDQPRGTFAGEALRAARERWEWPDFRRSWECADLVNVLNHDERAYLERIGLSAKTVVLPIGLTMDRRDALSAEASSAKLRHDRHEVALSGSWSPRKGSLDWGAIVRRTRAAIPAARFSFLGTWASEQRVLVDLRLPEADGITVLPQHHPDDLPRLLGPATVGALPSYAEGFPASVLDQLAAGLPTVAYDAPGARDLLRRIDASLMVPAGDTAAFAQRLVDIMSLTLEEYVELSERCREVGSELTWEAAVRETVDIYTGRMAAALV